MNDLIDTEPTWKLKHERPARIACVFDDVLSTRVMCMPSKGLVNLCIKHRHAGLGVSLFLLVQSYCAQGGVNRCIRENSTTLCLFRSSDVRQMETIYRESDFDNLSFEDFMKLYSKVFETPYNFLVCDFVNREFRSGCNDKIILP
eukprot:4140244-Pleurochrysis_carterae.AAC.7